MEIKNVMALVANGFIKGAASTIVVNKSADSSMNKGRGNNKNPYLGRVQIIKTYKGFVMGTDYAKSLENTASRMGNDDEKANLKNVWHHRVNGKLGEWFSTNKAEDKFYLKLQRNEQQVGFSTETEYSVDGRKATESEIAEIKSWMKKKSNTQSSTQIEMGIDKEHEQHFLLMELSTIVCIKQGDRVLYPQSLMREVVEVVPSMVGVNV